MVGRMKLTQLNLIDTLMEEQYREVRPEFREKKFKKKELIYPPGSDENLVYIVKEGRVKIYLGYEDKEFTLSILEPGDIYSTHTRSFALAQEDCTLLIMEVEGFRRLIESVPSLSTVMVKVLGDCLVNSIDIIEGLVFKQVECRMADFFLKLSEQRGIRTEVGIKANLDLNTEELASLVGSSRQTVSTIINAMEKDEIIKRSGKNITILNVNGLRELASNLR